MNKFLIIALIVVVAIGGLALLGSTNDSVGTFMQSTFGASGNVWCDNFEWYCCQATHTTKTETVAPDVYGACSTSANPDCVITNVQWSSPVKSSGTVYFGSVNCHTVKNFLYFNALSYTCDDMTSHKLSNGVQTISIPRGYNYFTDIADGKVALTVVTNGAHLVFTGASADASAGISVGGSSNCVWDVSLKNPKDGSAIGSPYSGTSTPLSLSYIVPAPNSGFTSCILSKANTQFLCGNIFDQCSSDSDCKGYPINGNQICTGGGDTGSVVQTYRCLAQNGLPSGVTQKSDGSYVGQPTIGGADSSKYSGTGKVCTVDQTLNKPVSCCPASSICGGNAFCDPATFTCKQTIECNVTSDCQTSPSCDYANLQYKTPVCSLNKCTYTSKAVGCCSDGNCADTQTCDLTSHTCKDKIVPKVLCSSFECCVGDALYIDKPCLNNSFCVNHVCSVEPQCSDTKPCPNPLNQICQSGLCKPANNDTCSAKFGGLVKGQVGVIGKCSSFWCSIGITKPDTTTTCVYDYMPVVLIGTFLLILTAILVFGLNKKKGHKKSSGKAKNIFRTKWFWRLFLGLGVLILLVLYFKFIFWMLLGILVVFILDAIFLHGIIRKVVF